MRKLALTNLALALLLLASCAGVEESGPPTTDSSTTTAPPGNGSTTTSLDLPTTTAATTTSSTPEVPTTLPSPVGEVTLAASPGSGPVWLGLGSEGFPMLVYESAENEYGRATELQMATCSDSYCTGPIDRNLLTEARAPRFIDNWTATVGPTGWPFLIITTWDWSTGEEDLSLLETFLKTCLDAECGASGQYQIGPWPDPDAVQGWRVVSPARIETAAPDHLLVEYRTLEGNAFYFLLCDLDGCPEDRLADQMIFQQEIPAGGVLAATSWSLGPDGNQALVLAGVDRWTLVRCEDPSCEPVTVSDIPWRPGALGNVDLLWGSDGLPMIAYDTFDRDEFTVWLTRCLSPACDSIEETPLVSRDAPTEWVIATGPAGLLVTAWMDADQLVLTRCADPACAAVETAATGFTAAEIRPGRLALVVRDNGEPLVAVAAQGEVRLFSCLRGTCEFSSES